MLFHRHRCAASALLAPLRSAAPAWSRP